MRAHEADDRTRVALGVNRPTHEDQVRNGKNWTKGTRQSIATGECRCDLDGDGVTVVEVFQGKCISHNESRGRMPAPLEVCRRRLGRAVLTRGSCVSAPRDAAAQSLKACRIVADSAAGGCAVSGDTANDQAFVGPGHPLGSKPDFAPSRSAVATV